MDFPEAKFLMQRNDETAGSDAARTACGNDTIDDSNMSLRIASIFILLVFSLLGAFFPILLVRRQRSHPKLRVVLGITGSSLYRRA